MFSCLVAQTRNVNRLRDGQRLGLDNISKPLNQPEPSCASLDRGTTQLFWYGCYRFLVTCSPDITLNLPVDMAVTPGSHGKQTWKSGWLVAGGELHEVGQ